MYNTGLMPLNIPEGALKSTVTVELSISVILIPGNKASFSALTLILLLGTDIIGAAVCILSNTRIAKYLMLIHHHHLL